MRTCIVSLLFSFASVCSAQDFHAIAGSNYAGALGLHNNPAAVVNTPFPWDVTVLGLQTKYQTNAISIIDYSLVSSPANSRFIIKGGSFERFGNAQSNLNIFNTRIAIGRKRAISFGANLRSVANIKTAAYNYKDTVESIQSFFSLNTQTGDLGVTLRTANQLEGYIGYAQTIIEHPRYRLNAGLTVKINRGLVGAQAIAGNVKHAAITGTPEKEYLVSGGNFGYGYSANIDGWGDNRSTTTNLIDFIRNTRYGFSVDAGLELIIKPAGMPGYMDDEESFYDYDWKIGAALVDVGRTQYNYGENSRQGTVPTTGFTANTLDQKFDSTIAGLSIFNDSLTTLIPVKLFSGYFNLYAPARIILNADRYIYGAWFVNAELSLNLTALLGKNRFAVKDMNLVRITPRWETRRWGLFMPLMVNTRGQFWVGAAGKAGPLLIGLHNLGNIFSKQKMANGGGYIALTIRPGNRVTGGKKLKMLDCPPY
jgi:hypothetical protein